MSSSPAITSVSLLVATALFFTACGIGSRANTKNEVEIAPAKWLTLEQRRGQCWFVCEWNGKRVLWQGKRDNDGELELPKTLREYKGNLYLIVLNREDMDAVKHIYLKLNPSGDKFTEISPAEFPKEIATENILDSRTRRVGAGNQWYDLWEVLRKLDIESPAFTRSTTAHIWIELETGLEQHEILKKLSYEERRKIIQDYKAKYNPIPLPTLVKEDKSNSESETNVVAAPE